MKLLRSFHALAFALVLLSIAGLCAAQQSVQLLLVAGTLAAMSWYVTEGPRGRTLPRRVSNVLVLAVSVNVFADLYQNSDDVMGVLGRFAVWLTLIKLYERRTARDHAHLLTLSLLLMMTGCLQSNNLLFGIILVLYGGLGLYVLLLYQLHASFEQARAARNEVIPADYRLAPPLKPIVGRYTALHFRGQALGVALAGVGLSVLIFVGFPRDVGVGMLGTLRVPSINRTPHFSWDIDLNLGGRINDSRVKVLTLQLTDSQGKRMRVQEPWRLRGAVLEDYKGQGRWAVAPALSRQLRSGEVELAPAGATADEAAKAVTQRIILNRPAAGDEPIFSIYAPVSVAADGDVELLYDPRTQTMKTDESARRLMSYTVKAQVAPSDATLERLTWGNRSIAPSRLPNDENSVVRQLAESVLKRAGMPLTRPSAKSEVWNWNRDAAAVLTAYLQSGGAYTYTTDLTTIKYRDNSVDPIVRFLTETKRGHCEFFASGLVALCRSMGIPARIVVGYVASNYDEAAQQYNVLESSAHAWTEVATGPHRWTTYDPTPPATLMALHNGPSGFTDKFRDLYTSLDGGWSKSVVGFDGAAQDDLAQSLNQRWSKRFAATFQAVRDWMERVNLFFNVGPGGYIWMGIVALALLIAVVALIKLMRRSMAVRRTLQLQHLRGAEYQRMLRQLGFYLDMLHVLKRAGQAKPYWQPPMDYAQALVQRQPVAAQIVRGITDLFYAARYGHQRLGRDEMERAGVMIRQLAATLNVRI